MSPSHLEKLIAQAVAAERAGVFRRTDVGALLPATGRRPAPVILRWRRVAAVAVPLAACVALAVLLRPGADGGSGRLVSDIGSAPGAVVVRCHAVDLTVERFNSCFTGPGADALTEECGCADIDDDGDVDMMDFGRYQVAVAREVPAGA